jgi:hypothetical protein
MSTLYEKRINKEICNFFKGVNKKPKVFEQTKFCLERAKFRQNMLNDLVKAKDHSLIVNDIIKKLQNKFSGEKLEFKTKLQEYKGAKLNCLILSVNNESKRCHLETNDILKNLNLKLISTLGVKNQYVHPNGYVEIDQIEKKENIKYAVINEVLLPKDNGSLVQVCFNLAEYDIINEPLLENKKDLIELNLNITNIAIIKQINTPFLVTKIQGRKWEKNIFGNLYKPEDTSKFMKHNSLQILEVDCADFLFSNLPKKELQITI